MGKLSNPTPLIMAALRAMGMIRLRGTSGYALTRDSKGESEEEGDAPEDFPAAPSNSPPTAVPIETVTDVPSPIEQEALAESIHPSTRARNRLARLDAVHRISRTNSHHGRVIYYP